MKSTVYKIGGSSPSSNYINLPKHTGQSLGLTGRYIYFLFKPSPSKYFSIHIDITTAENIIIRLSLSNLFKEFKATSTWLQFPYVVQSPTGSVYEKIEQNAKDLSGQAPPVTKWTILCVDLKSMMQMYSNRTFQSVRGFKLCANMLVKNVITSDLLYEPGMTYAESRLKSNGNSVAFPRELAYPCDKGENWHIHYDYIAFPSESYKRPFDSVGQSNQIVSNNSNEPKRALVNQENTQSRNMSSINHLKAPKYKLTNKSKVFNLPMVGVVDDTTAKNNQDDNLNFVSPDVFEHQNHADIHVYPFQKHEINDDDDDDDDCFSPSSGSSSGLYNNDELKIIEENNSECLLKSKSCSNLIVEKFQTSLEPDPILRLRKIIGFGSRNFSTAASNSSSSNDASNFTSIFQWSRDSDYLIYGCQAIVVALNLNTNEQYCFVGHSYRVSCLSMSPCGAFMASGQAGSHSLVRLWDFQTRKCVAIFRNHDHSLYILEFSSCGNYLCGVGRDKQGKTLLIIWDIKNGKQNNAFRMVAKAHSDIHINRILFVHFDSTRLISCGRDNVRFWRLKNDTLRSCAANITPYLNALNQNNTLEFTDICMNSRANNNENLVYSCTNAGQIFVFNMARMEIETVRVLEPIVAQKSHGGILLNGNSNQVPPSLKLNSLTVSDSCCVTGSEDGYVRIFKLDFSQVIMEAEHDASIGLVRFSADCSRIATATLSGNLGVLEVKKKEYSTLVRSHTDSITDIAINKSCKYIVTCSTDFSVRVWCFETGRQLYDFSSSQNNDRPNRVCFYDGDELLINGNNKQQNVFSVGFSSGKIRVFDVQHAKLIQEIKSPHNNSGNHAKEKKCEITDLKYCCNGKRLISGDSLKYICLYNTDGQYSLIRLLPNTISVGGSLTISPDSKHAALIGPNDFLISDFDSFNLNEILRINIITSSNTNTDNSNTTNQFIDTNRENALRLAYANSHELNQLVCVTSSNKLLKFDSKTGRLLSSVGRIHRSMTDCLTTSSDGVYLATSGDNCIKIWDYEMRLEKNYQVSFMFLLLCTLSLLFFFAF